MKVLIYACESYNHGSDDLYSWDILTVKDMAEAERIAYDMSYNIITNGDDIMEVLREDVAQDLTYANVPDDRWDQEFNELLEEAIYESMEYQIYTLRDDVDYDELIRAHPEMTWDEIRDEYSLDMV